jgi:hypothetical protein
MLSDFHPKGQMAASFGMYSDKAGTTLRATVIVDANGIVKHASAGREERDMAAIVALCKEMDDAHVGELADMPAPAPKVAAGSTLYVRNNCGPSRSVLLARTNLHLEEHLEVKNVSESSEHLAELEATSGGKTAPVLVSDGKVVAESSKIVAFLAG